MAGRGGIEALLDLLDEAFRGRGIETSNESQALLTNLASVPLDAWTALPPGASRSITAIAVHVGACKIMYDDYAFGPGTLTFGTPEVEPWRDRAAARDELTGWLDRASTSCSISSRRHSRERGWRSRTRARRS